MCYILTNIPLSLDKNGQLVVYNTIKIPQSLKVRIIRLIIAT